MTTHLVLLSLVSVLAIPHETWARLGRVETDSHSYRFPATYGLLVTAPRQLICPCGLSGEAGTDR